MFRSATIDEMDDLLLADRLRAARRQRDALERRKRREPREQPGNVGLGVGVALDRDPRRGGGRSRRRRGRGRGRRRRATRLPAARPRALEPDVLGKDPRDVAEDRIPGDAARRERSATAVARAASSPATAASIVGPGRRRQRGDLAPGPRRAAACLSADLPVRAEVHGTRARRAGRPRRSAHRPRSGSSACSWCLTASFGSRSTLRIAMSSIASPIGTAIEPIAASIAGSKSPASVTRASGSPTDTLTPIIWWSASPSPSRCDVPPVIDDPADTERLGLGLVELERADELARERRQPEPDGVERLGARRPRRARRTAGRGPRARGGGGSWLPRPDAPRASCAIASSSAPPPQSKTRVNSQAPPPATRSVDDSCPIETTTVAVSSTAEPRTASGRRTLAVARAPRGRCPRSLIPDPDGRPRRTARPDRAARRRAERAVSARLPRWAAPRARGSRAPTRVPRRGAPREP